MFPVKNRKISMIKNWASLLCEPRKILALRYLPHYFFDWRKYKNLSNNTPLLAEDSYPCLEDKIPFTPFDPHYFYQAAWLAGRLKNYMPDKHVDVGSSVGMVSILCAFIPVIFVDHRPLKVDIKGLLSVAGDALALPFASSTIGSLSCLHVIEHIGLGRYGDPINPAGSYLAAKELSRVLAVGGKLFLSLPVGHERIHFNAHRVFSPASVSAMFGNLKIEQFHLIDDGGHYIPHADFKTGATCNYGCGFFEMIKTT
jgi:hypothetical protein